MSARRRRPLFRCPACGKVKSWRPDYECGSCKVERLARLRRDHSGQLPVDYVKPMSAELRERLERTRADWIARQPDGHPWKVTP